MTPDSSVPVTLAGRGMTVRFSLGALARAQKALGVDTLADVFRAYDKVAAAFVGPGGDPVYKWYEFDLSALGALLWAGTRAWAEAAGEPPATPESLIADLDFQELSAAMLAVTAAMSLAFQRYDARAKPAGEAGAAGRADAGPPPAVPVDAAA